MSDAEDDYDAADSGAADCTPIEAGSVRKGGFLVIKGRPCKVVDVTKAKVGKHGAAKCHMIGVDIFTSKKLEMVCPASAGLGQPNVGRDEYQLCGLEEEFMSLMDKNSNIRDDLKLPEDAALRAKIEEAAEDDSKEYLITILTALGHEQAIDMKTALA
eukprot:CAMPEP_0181312816 /NCGR_PEP_ID=MMETSP1101-20121128/13904_1 /TAXON_ID=46948 /ORGANISM="Rhodomonas abbreviata, Strain Caron Lab Isolate" /LENGTH=157 /DNA_ID=CAMNT_0023419703 /DNA_START=12 /DNA_END=485 /DNA_ORIENTATION=-